MAVRKNGGNGGTFAAISELLAPFLEKHPFSELREVSRRKETVLAIANPWNDSSLEIIIPDDPNTLAGALNSVLLPERFSALWHRDSNDFEIIYTAFPLTNEQESAIKDRGFTFNFEGKAHKCEFGRSSEKLLGIARHARPVSPSLTEYRNLLSYWIYTEHLKAKEDDTKRAPPIPVGEPVSFWIRNLQCGQDSLFALTVHLNFYMTYYDRRSPTIVIHTPAPESVTSEPQERYRVGRFPAQISGRQIDINLLHFWVASRSGDPARRFLYSYRIIEYASFSYLEAGAKSSVRRLLSSPHVLDDLDRTVESVVSAVEATKLHENQKFDAVVRDMVDPAVLWAEINRNISVFSCETEFDGGFKIGSIGKVGWKEDDFGINGVANFAKVIRDIRNALSHGRDQRTVSVILPTPLNFQRLQPWASLIALAAGEVIVYRSV